jgi:HEAT repeat protein
MFDNGSMRKPWEGTPSMNYFDRDVVRTLARNLRSRDRFVRRHAVSLLAELGPDAVDAVEVLGSTLQDTEEEVAIRAARALGRIGEPALAYLIEALAHSCAAVRREAVWALKDLGALAFPALRELLNALRDLDTRVQLGAAQALGAIGPAAVQAVPHLIDALKSNNLIFCRLAAQALANIGRPALPALYALLNTTDRHTRRDATWAIQQIRAETVTLLPDDTVTLNTITQVLDHSPSHVVTELLRVEITND